MANPQIAELLSKVTELGDATYLAPLVCGLAVALWMTGDRRNARALALAFGLCLALVVASKIALITVYRGGPLRSPSGHSAIAAFFYGSIAMALVRRSGTGFARIAIAALCVGLVLLIVVSRFEIGGHSRTEAVLGLVFGAICVAFLDRKFRWSARRPTAVAAVAGAIVALVAYGVLAQGYFDEEAIRGLALWLRALVTRA